MLAGAGQGDPTRQWIVTLGGWSEEQFLDDPRGFPLRSWTKSRRSSGRVAGDLSPQLSEHSGLRRPGSRQNTRPGRRPHRERRAREVDGLVAGPGGVAFVAPNTRSPEKDQWRQNARDVVRYLNSVGPDRLDGRGRSRNERRTLRTVSRACRSRRAQRAHLLETVRQPGTPEEVDKVVAEIPAMKPFQGTDYFDNVGFGESVYSSIDTQLLSPKSNTRPEDFAQWRRDRARACRAWALCEFTRRDGACDRCVSRGNESVHKEKPIKGLRWAFSHLDQVDAAADRAHEAARHDGTDPYAAADPGCAHAQVPRRSGMVDAAHENGPGERNHVGAGLGRDRCDDLEPVLQPLVRSHRQDGRRQAK